MSATTVGNKFTCFSCQTKFYDLNKPEAICPKCKANQKDAPKEKKPPSRAKAEKARPEPVKVPIEEPDVDDVVVGDADDVPDAGDMDDDDDED